MATYGNLGTVSLVTARSLYARNLIVAVPIDQWTQDRHAQLTADGWAYLSADERAQAISKAQEDAARWATLAAQKFTDNQEGLTAP